MTIKELYESPIARVLVPGALLLVAWMLLKGNVLPAPAEKVLLDISNTGLNEADLEMQTRNYYREVSDVNIGRFAGVGMFLEQLGLKPPRLTKTGEPPALSKTSIVHRNHRFLPWELNPDQEIVFLEHPFRTNRWGMRDRDYELAKPANTFRIAIVGASNTMGNGVNIEEAYSELLEERLNAEKPGPFAQYEVLNFSVGGYDLTDRLFVASEKVPAFEPDLILIVVLQRDRTQAVYQRVAERLANDDPLHFDFLKRIAEEAGVQPGDREGKLRQRLKPFRARLLRDCAAEMKRLSERSGISVAALVLNIFVGPKEQDLIDAAIACESTGLPTLRIFDAYSDHSEEEIYQTPTDRHPRPLGHRLIADDLYNALLAHPQFGSMIRGGAPSGTP